MKHAHDVIGTGPAAFAAFCGFITTVNYARAKVAKILVSGNFLPSRGILRLMQVNSFVMVRGR